MSLDYYSEIVNPGRWMTRQSPSRLARRRKQMQPQEEVERIQRENQMDQAWEMIRARNAANPSTEPAGPMPPTVPTLPDMNFLRRMAPLEPYTQYARYLLVTHASKPDHSKVIAMDGKTKGASWTLPSATVDAVLQIVSTLGFEVSDLRDED